jgi:hypothetical protein
MAARFLYMLFLRVLSKLPPLVAQRCKGEPSSAATLRAIAAGPGPPRVKLLKECAWPP